MANDALSGDNVTIWFAPASAAGTTFAADAAKFQGFIQGFDKSGGEKDTEAISVFSDTGEHGNIDRAKPRSQIELGFEIVLRHDTRITDFGKIERSEVIAADGAGADFIVGQIIVQQTDGTDFFYKAFNNVSATVFDDDFAADEEWKGTLKFKVSATDANGVTNVKDAATDAEVTLSWP